ncbi:MAG TPA: GNAT family N-acetyltransferase [Solimonas sp.]|nr:GNAT family N-acetyltransferase [Solimonas sp.]
MTSRILESERLYLRPYTWDDLGELRRLNSDPEVMRYLGGVESEDATRAMLRDRILAYYDANPGLGVWATHRKADHAHLGFHLLNQVREGNEIQVGYRLYPEHWGQGYATEMARALLRYGFEERQLPEIVAMADVGNTASRHVLEKIGLVWYRQHPYVGLDCHWYRTSREAWLAAAG